MPMPIRYSAAILKTRMACIGNRHQGHRSGGHAVPSGERASTSAVGGAACMQCVLRVSDSLGLPGAGSRFACDVSHRVARSRHRMRPRDTHIYVQTYIEHLLRLCTSGLEDPVLPDWGVCACAAVAPRHWSLPVHLQKSEREKTNTETNQHATGVSVLHGRDLFQSCCVCLRRGNGLKPSRGPENSVLLQNCPDNIAMHSRGR